jgi:hypothetical protein
MPESGVASGATPSHVTDLGCAMDDVNAVFEEFATLFASNSRAEGGFPSRRRVPSGQLDYSVASLRLVDDYLLRLHRKCPSQLEGRWVNAILWVGAYVGEVLRRNASMPYRWVDFEDWIAAHPDHVDMLGPTKSLILPAVLSPGSDSFTLPVTKAGKCILNGPEDSVHFYAHVSLDGP